jgi:hypothetical protein
VYKTVINNNSELISKSALTKYQLIIVYFNFNKQGDIKNKLFIEKKECVLKTARQK